MDKKAEPLNIKLWNDIKNEMKEKYSKRWNAFYSGLLVQEYKRRGGEFSKKVQRGETALKRWFDEDWKDIGGKKYPVFRPTRRVTKKTPLIVSEIDPKNLKTQIAKKQKLAEEKNLEPFKKKK
jgi:hypothetical protein